MSAVDVEVHEEGGDKAGRIKGPRATGVGRGGGPGGLNGKGYAGDEREVVPILVSSNCTALS